jgi:hypothetical protein
MLFMEESALEHANTVGAGTRPAPTVLGSVIAGFLIWEPWG